MAVIGGATGYACTVNNGTWSCSATTEGVGPIATYTVTITANEMAGYVFKEWVVNSGGITLANKNSSTTTFTMPSNAVEVTAIYESIGMVTSALSNIILKEQQ